MPAFQSYPELLRNVWEMIFSSMGGGGEIRTQAKQRKSLMNQYLEE